MELQEQVILDITYYPEGEARSRRLYVDPRDVITVNLKTLFKEK